MGLAHKGSGRIWEGLEFEKKYPGVIAEVTCNSFCKYFKLNFEEGHGCIITHS